ncbi:MAG: bi-domain-containing oxidoreductase [Acidobacteriota bacterium]
MKQIVQSYKTGSLELAEVPVPALKSRSLLVRSAASLISIGTERYMLGMAQKSLLGKALARPDQVRQVLNKARLEGPVEAYRQALARLDEPVPLGYSAAGTVIEIGAGVRGFASGDRVACSGSGVACHAEVLCVPQTLAVRIPDNVSFDAACFVTLGSIALHAVRIAASGLADRVVVLGLGLIGQLAVQIVRSAGSRVCALDICPEKVEMARKYGAHVGAVIERDDVVAVVRGFTDGRGADTVLVFAATESNHPIELAAELARIKGRIVVPGLVGLDIPRRVFYEKELDLTVSRAWGPGMYDLDYESGERDYPYGFVRWTAQRNMAAFLQMVSDEQVRISHLVTHRFPIARALEAYDLIMAGKKETMGVVLQYPERVELKRTIQLSQQEHISRQKVRTPAESIAVAKDTAPRDPVRIGLIGAGLFARGTLLPALTPGRNAVLRGVVTSTGIHADHVARRYNAAYATTDPQRVLDDPQIDLVMILTRHGSHADFVKRALKAGKHVFVEKPLAIRQDELEEVIEVYQHSPGRLMVGFNRRYAPTTRFMLEQLKMTSGPRMVSIRANVGQIPPDLWVHDPLEGGGNLIGEACHFVDLIQALTGSEPMTAFAESVQSICGIIKEDNLVIVLTMRDGSLGNIVYTAVGDKGYPRERVEIFAGGAVGVIDDFRTATWTQTGKRKGVGHLWSGVDRGHKAEMLDLVCSLKEGREFPVPFHSYVTTTLTTFAATRSMLTRQPVPVELG